MLKTISHIILTALLFVGFLFKFMHWPGAGPTLFSALVVLILTLIGYAFENIRKKTDFRNTIIPLLGALFVLSAIFKIMHWPGANIILSVSMIGISLFAFELTIRLRREALALIPALFGVLFMMAFLKIMQWPQPPYVMLVCNLLFITITPSLFYVRGKKLNRESPLLSGSFMSIAGLGLVAGLLELNIMFDSDGYILPNYVSRLFLTLVYLSQIIVLGNALKYAKRKHRSEYLILQCLRGILIAVLVFFVLIKAH